MNEFARDDAPSAPTPPPLPTPPRAPRPRRATGCLIAAGVALGLAALCLVLLATLLDRVTGGLQAWIEQQEADESGEYGVDEFPPMQETWSAGAGERKVVRIPLRGAIFLGDGGGWRSGEAGADLALRAIRRATLDTEAAGILLEIDSGGGGMTASDILYEALQRFRRADTNRVIVVHMGNVAASGAYYISLAGDRIVAHPTTVTGSIGVILSSVNLSDLARRLGIRDDSVISGEGKLALNPLTEMTPEQRALLQRLVDSLHQRFVGLVATQRNLERERVEALSDGRIFLADEALNEGLIDRIGYLEDAQAEVAELLGVEQVRFVRYSQRASLADLLRSPGFWGAVLSEGLPRLQRTLQQPSYEFSP